MSVDDAAVVICMMPASVVTATTGIVSWLVTGPTMAPMPSFSISRRASLTPCVGSVIESAMMSSTFLPRMPPLALMSSTASFHASVDDTPTDAPPPVTEVRPPILKTSCANVAPAPSPSAAAVASAMADRRLITPRAAFALEKLIGISS